MIFEKVADVQYLESFWRLMSLFNISQIQRKLQTVLIAEKSISHALNLYSNKSVFLELISLWKLNKKKVRFVFNQEKTLEGLLIPNKKLRQKRALIDLGGIVLKELFGTLTINDGKQFENEILLSKRHEMLMSKLLDKQIKLTEENIFCQNETIMKINEKVNNISEDIQKELLNNRLELNNVEVYSILFTKIELFSQELNDIEYILEQIIQAVTFVRLNVVHPFIFNSKILLKELSHCKSYLHQDQNFPFSLQENELNEIYKFLSVTVYSLYDNIYFEISVPIVKTTTFDLYNLMPAPVKKNEGFIFIVPDEKYLLYSEELSLFTTMNSLNSCKRIGDHRLMCKHDSPLLNIHTNQKCELDILRIKSSLSKSCHFRKVKVYSENWMKLDMPNSWLFFVPHRCKLTIKCNRKAFTRYISNLGSLHLSQSCTAFTEYVNLISIPDEPIYTTMLEIPINIDDFNFSFDKIPTSDIPFKIQINPIRNLPFIHNLHNRLQSQKDELSNLQSELEFENKPFIYTFTTKTWQTASLIILICIILSLVFLFVLIKRAYINLMKTIIGQ